MQGHFMVPNDICRDVRWCVAYKEVVWIALELKGSDGVACGLLGVKDGSLGMILFKASILNVEIEFKVVLIAFGSETVSASPGLSSREKKWNKLMIHSLNHIQSLSDESIIATRGSGLSTPGMEAFVLSTKDFIKTKSLSLELEGSLMS
nr:hypothetical protein [Tanacetum cinerariifolium]